jgi:uncharacterized protein (DUF2252 family)
MTNNEFGHLFYTELNNKGAYATTTPMTWQNDCGLKNTGPFSNLELIRK